MFFQIFLSIIGLYFDWKNIKEILLYFDIQFWSFWWVQILRKDWLVINYRLITKRIRIELFTCKIDLVLKINEWKRPVELTNQIFILSVCWGPIVLHHKWWFYGDPQKSSCMLPYEFSLSFLYLFEVGDRRHTKDSIWISF